HIRGRISVLHPPSCRAAPPRPFPSEPESSRNGPTTLSAWPVPQSIRPLLSRNSSRRGRYTTAQSCLGSPGTRSSAADAENDFHAEGHDLVCDKKEHGGEERHGDHHDRRDHRLTAVRPCDLRGLCPDLLQKYKWIGDP